MKLSSLFLLLTTLPLLATTEEQLHKQFTVQPGGKIIVDVAFGKVSVTGGDANEVVVDVLRKIGRTDKAAEETFLRENPVELVQDGGTVTIRNRSKSNRALNSWFGNGKRNEAKYTITVPAKFNAELKTSGGDVTVENLAGATRADTSGGALRFEHLHGNLWGGTSGGSIRASDCEGDLKIHTSGGRIDFSGGSGSLDAGTSGGSIEVKNFKGPTHVDTSGGGITIENHTGGLIGSTSGGSIEASLVGALGDAIKLTTSGGGITVRVPANAAFDLDAETTGGGIKTEFDVPTGGKPNPNHVKGSVNGGGKSVVLRTSGGGIHVKKS